MSKYHHYKECGLDDVYLVNGFRMLPTPRGEAVQIDDIPGLHKVIGFRLVNEKKKLSGTEVRFLRHELGLTQRNLGAIVGVDAQTVARWETGETDRVSPAADRLLRLICGEQIGGNPRVCEPLRRIAELDASSGAEIVRMLFEDDPQEGWRPRQPDLQNAA